MKILFSLLKYLPPLGKIIYVNKFTSYKKTSTPPSPGVLAKRIHFKTSFPIVASFLSGVAVETSLPFNYQEIYWFYHNKNYIIWNKNCQLLSKNFSEKLFPHSLSFLQQLQEIQRVFPLSELNLLPAEILFQ